MSSSRFGVRLTAGPATLRISPAGSGKLADLEPSTPLKLLEQKGSSGKVQTFSGDVGWVEAGHVTKR